MSSEKTVFYKPGLFEGMTEKEIDAFSVKLKRMKFPRGTQIITENEPADSLFFICKGRVEINKGLKNFETPAAQLSILEPGDFFGEMSVVDEEPRSASVLALEAVELLVIPKEVFIELSFKHPPVMLNLIRTLSSRLRSTNELFAGLMDDMISQNRLKAIGMAASKIIHDIKTPLTVIVLTAQLVENLFPGSDEFTQSIVRQTRLIDQLVREILDFSQGVESTPLIQKVDLIRFVEDLREMNEVALKGRDISFVVENKVDDFVYFDENKIRRVLMNLIKNASEAIDAGKEIKLTASMTSGWLQISVIDNGPGIPPRIRDRIFEPFVTEGKVHGTGLGLPICRKLVQEHRGRLEYIPLEPTGSRFDIRIPQTIK